MKTFFLLTLLTAGLALRAAPITPTNVAPIPPEATHFASEAEFLEFLSRARVSVGSERGTVLEQLGEPQALPNPDVWIFTGFRASNVFGAERLDTLVVGFKDERVVKLTLTTQAAVRAAATRPARPAAAKIAAK